MVTHVPTVYVTLRILAYLFKMAFGDLELFGGDVHEQ